MRLSHSHSKSGSPAPKLAVEPLTVHGLISVNKFVECARQELRFNCRGDTDFERALSSSLEQVGVAFASDCFWRNLQEVFEMAARQDFACALMQVNCLSRQEAEQTAKQI